MVVAGWENLWKSTADWNICCGCKDGSTLCKTLSNLMELHPIQIAKYAIAHGIQHEPACNWWIHHVLMKRDRIIFMVRWHSAWYLKRIHELGLVLPKTVNEAYAIDKKNGNTLWWITIQKEMKNVKIAFQAIPKGEKPPNGFHNVNCHMVFDIKMEDFNRNAHLVVGGHMTHTFNTITYQQRKDMDSIRSRIWGWCW